MPKLHQSSESLNRRELQMHGDLDTLFINSLAIYTDLYRWTPQFQVFANSQRISISGKVSYEVCHFIHSYTPHMFNICTYLSLGLQQVQNLIEDTFGLFLACHITAAITAHCKLYQAVVAFARGIQ